MNELVSVIIPVYNTAKYLDMCLESVVGQTYKNLQIVLVDDGSTDDISPQKCDEWSQKDSRIQVIHKENEGLGFTRNAGLRAAEGVYVCFLDSDDTIELYTIEECVKTLTAQSADACYYGRKTQQSDGSIVINHNIPDKLVYVEEEVKREFASRYFGPMPEQVGVDYIQGSACCAMYRRSIITNNNIIFRSERECLSEDTFFNLDVCSLADKVIIIPKDYYNYTYNPQSLTKSYNPNKFCQVKRYYELLQKYSLNYQEVCNLNIRMSYTFYVFLRQVIEYEVHAKTLIGFKAVYENVKKICEDTYVQECLKKMSLADKFKGKRRLFVDAISKRWVLFLMAYYLLVKRK